MSLLTLSAASVAVPLTLAVLCDAVMQGLPVMSFAEYRANMKRPQDGAAGIGSPALGGSAGQPGTPQPRAPNLHTAAATSAIQQPPVAAVLMSPSGRPVRATAGRTKDNSEFAGPANPAVASTPRHVVIGDKVYDTSTTPVGVIVARLEAELSKLAADKAVLSAQLKRLEDEEHALAAAMRVLQAKERSART